MEIELGIMAPALSEQLAGTPLTEEKIDHYERVHWAIAMLRLHRFLSDREAERMRVSLVEQIAADIRTAA